MAYAGNQPGREASILRFDAFELDTSSGELRKHGLRIKLQDQPVSILLLLLENPGKVISRAEIQDALWGKETTVDFDNAINTAIRKLREALGDDAGKPRFIETVARRGYRFKPEQLTSSNGTGMSTEKSGSVEGIRTRHILAIAGCIAAASIALYVAAERQRTATLSGPAIPLTAYPGSECCPSFSPDGSRVAFSWNGPDRNRYHVYIKQIGLGEPMRLTDSTAPETFPAWSPDGRWIAFLRASSEGPYWDAAIIIVPSLRGPEREIARLRMRGGLSWSQDGRFLFAVDSERPDGPERIARIAVDSGERIYLTEPDTKMALRDSMPSVSPDGRSLVFKRSMVGDNSELFLLQLPMNGNPVSSQPRQLTFDASRIFGHAWTADGKDLVYSSSRGGRVALWRVAPSNPGKPTAVVGVGENSALAINNGGLPIAISRQGQLVFPQARAPGLSVWKWERGEGDASGAKPFAASTTGEHTPQFSPDGTKVALTSFRTGLAQIWVFDAAGKNGSQLTAFEAQHVGSPQWSPDGKRIVFDGNISGIYQIYVIDSSGGHATQLTREASHSAMPSFSHDGKWIHFTSRRSGRSEIWKMRPDGSSPTQVTRDGANIGRLSADSQALYFTKSEQGSALWQLSLVDGKESKIAERIRWRNVVVLPKVVYLLEEHPDNTVLAVFDPVTGRTRRIASLGITANLGLSVSPDERTVLFTKSNYPDTDLMLVENFR